MIYFLLISEIIVHLFDEFLISHFKNYQGFDLQYSIAGFRFG